jgi:predicted GH43/DUF377 family glycosyl hydrolase
MAGFAQGPATLVLDDVVRVYFSCRPKPDARNQYVSYAAYVDLDRGDLSRVVSVSARPILDLGGRGTFDEFGTYPVSVIRDGDRIRAYYGGWTRCASVPFDVAIGCAISRDGGVRFDKYGAGPVLAADLHEPFVISGPKIRRFGDRWYLWYIAGTKWIPTGERPEPVYRIRMATSDDGLQWDRLHRELIPPRLEADECQASPDVIFANGKYHMFFCFRYSLGYRGREKGYRIGYASSTDLVTWQRDDAKAGIDVAEQGWDSEMISYPHVFELDGQMLMLYLGNEVGRHGFGLAALEGDLS